jgi:uncharacterized membrane protein (DUF106 family)
MWIQFIVILFSIITTIFSEIINWLLVYRTTAFKENLANYEKSKKKLNQLKQSGSSGGGKKKGDKKIEEEQKILDEYSQKLQIAKFKSGVLLAVVMFIVTRLFNAVFEGVVVGMVFVLYFTVFL